MLDLGLEDKIVENETGTVQKPPFNNKLWREILCGIAKKASNRFNMLIECISPFGFEVLMDKDFLSRNLRRFYCYIGIDLSVSEKDKTAIMEYFYHEIMHEISIKYSSFFSSVVLVITGATFIYFKDKTYECAPTDKLIDIQLRTVKKNILEDYSNYIITSLEGLMNEKGETRGYKGNVRNRWRFYQLYIIQEQLYKEYVPQMSPSEQSLFNSIFKITSNMINIFFENRFADGRMALHEAEIFECLIMPRLKLIYKAISSDEENLISTESTAYHYNDKLSITMDKKIYTDTMLKIQDTYINYA